MSVQEIIDLALEQSYSKDVGFTDAQLVKFLNISYHRLEKRIKTLISNDYFYKKFETNIVTNQNRYNLANALDARESIDQIISVDVMNSDGRWTRHRAVNNETLDEPINDLEDYGEPVFDIKNGTIILYPTPKENVANGLLVQATSTLKDLKQADDEDAIYPNSIDLRDWHYILAIHMRSQIFQAQGMYNEKVEALQDYAQEERELLNNLRMRYKSAVRQNTEDLTYLAR